LFALKSVFYSSTAIIQGNPFYSKSPGIRENGGQYTHAALWAVWAFAELGQGDRAEALFRLLNPIYHSDTPEKMMRYRVEPYVVALGTYPRNSGSGSHARFPAALRLRSGQACGAASVDSGDPGGSHFCFHSK
jgi:cellobiose phosphorylase